ncbi:hypothetical protein C6B38_07975, partial [Spiroplasma sp. ChiS]
MLLIVINYHHLSPKNMKIIKQQKICDVINCYKLSSFITEEFETNKILWTCENHKVLLNQI